LGETFLLLNITFKYNHLSFELRFNHNDDFKFLNF